MSSFVHLHLHSQYSLLDGANRLDDVIGAAKAAGMSSLALTDHGNLFGAVEFYKRARRQGMNPIVGMEAYVAQGSHTARERGKASSNHLVLLAKNETGYRNLIKLTSKSYLEGFYYKPRIDKELLREHGEGLIGLSACLKGEVIEKILQHRQAEAEATAREFRDILGEDNFYLEMQDHGIEEQKASNEILRRISKKTEIPLVVTNDCHYLRKDDAFAHDVLLCIGTQKVLSDQERLRYASDEFYLKTADEMFQLFPDDVQAVENTARIAERCNLEIPMGEFFLPDFPVPAGHSLNSYFEEVVRHGLDRRLDEIRRRRADVLEKFPEDIYRQRLDREVAVIRNMGFAGYFLTVWDFIRYARERDIPVGPGRGSAAGSLVSYALRITDIDPLQYGLLFERFLNPERVSLPDIDIDFCMRRRGEVIQYVNQKYGRDHVAQIITFGTLAAKAVLRDVGRVMGVPYTKVDQVAKLIPDLTRSLTEAVESSPPLAGAINGDADLGKVVDVGKRLEGLTRHASLHAAGVVITPQPTQELVPLFKTSKDEVVTQWDKDVIEELGLLKMDFLGLRTLTVLDDALRTLRSQGIDLDLDNLPLDDSEVYRLFQEGRTSGIFQFESSGMRDLLKRAQPSKFEDLAAFNALYRPGALSVGMVEEYIKRKLGKKRVSYVVPEAEPILSETYGVIAYQEQVMQLAVELAGFTLADADLLRKAMGKKSAEAMAKEREKFIQGAIGKGIPKAKARKTWEYIEPFAGYGFNKSHSVAYAMLAYRTAYLKAHHPVAFMAAMLTSEMASKDNVAKYMRECKETGIPVEPPDVNESNWSFTVVDDKIRFGLGAIKGVGSSAVEAILEARRHVGRFEDLSHFAGAVDLKAVNQKVFEMLIKSGSFDSLGVHRAALLESVGRIVDFAQQQQRAHEQGQSSLFSADTLPTPKPDPSAPEWSEPERLRCEKEALGLYLTGNPLSEHEDILSAKVTHTATSLENAEGSVVVGGIVSAMRRIKIKSGRNAGKFMARFILEDFEGAIPVAVFSSQLEKFGKYLVDEAIVLVKGIVRERGSDSELTIEEVTPLAELRRQAVSRLDVVIQSGLSENQMMALRDCLIEHHGEVPVHLQLDTGKQKVDITPEDRFRVAPSAGFMKSVEEIVGRGNVHKRFPA
ncbi:MAG: DNA polymerase III subunit alpha [bacterium]|nr:DNA polymerase III subunit alpha [bacterium]